MSKLLLIFFSYILPSPSFSYQYADGHVSGILLEKTQSEHENLLLSMW